MVSYAKVFYLWSDEGIFTIRADRKVLYYWSLTSRFVIDQDWREGFSFCIVVWQGVHLLLSIDKGMLYNFQPGIEIAGTLEI